MKIKIQIDFLINITFNIFLNIKRLRLNGYCMNIWPLSIEFAPEFDMQFELVINFHFLSFV